MRSMLTGRNQSTFAVMAFAGAMALTATTVLAAPIVYVDNQLDYTPQPVSIGDVVTWNGIGGPVPGLIYGTNAFGSIQDGLDAVDPGGTVWVAQGTYAENPVISTSGVTLRGPQYLGSGASRVTNPQSDTLEPILPDDTTEAILIPGVSYLLDGTLLTIHADNVTVEGMMFSGLNSDLGSGFHAARGISNGKETNDQFLDNLTDFMDDVDRVVVRNNILTSFERMCILFARNDAAASDVLPGLITGNYVTGQSGAAVAIPPPYSPFLNSQFERTGIWTGNNFYADITNNVITRTALGILVNTHELPPEDNSQTFVTNNSIRSEVLGLWVDRVSNTGGGIRIAGNVVRSPYRTGMPLPNPFPPNANGFRNDGFRLSFVSTVGAIEVEGNQSFNARYGLLTYGVEDTANIIWKGGVLTASETSIYALNWLDALPAPLTPGPSNLTIEGVNINGAVLDSIAVEDIYHIDGVAGTPQPTRVTLSGNTSMTNFQLSAVFVYGPESEFATLGPSVSIVTAGPINPGFGPQPVINVFDGGPNSLNLTSAQITTNRPVAGIWVSGFDASAQAILRNSTISNPTGGPTGEIIRVDTIGTFLFDGLNQITGHIVNDGVTIASLNAPASIVRFLGPSFEQRIDTIPPGLTDFPTMQIADNVRVLEIGEGLTTRSGPLLFNIGGNSVLERVLFGLSSPASEDTLLDFGLTEAQIIFEPAGGNSVGLNGITELRVQRLPVAAITPQIPSNEKFNILGDNFDSAVTIKQLRLPVATPTLAAFQAAYPGPVIHKTSIPARFFFLTNADYSPNVPGGTGFVTYNGFVTEPSLIPPPWIEQRSDTETTPFFVSNNLTVLKVELVGFEAVLTGDRVALNWSTASEINHAGFNVHRVPEYATSAMPSSLSKLNHEMVSAQGGPNRGADYSVLDDEPMAWGESRSYMLEEIDVNGIRAFHGPVTVMYGTSGSSSVRGWELY